MTSAEEAKWLEGIEADHNRYPDARLNWTYETTRRVLVLARRGLQTPQERINNCGLEKVCFTEASEDWQAEKERLEAKTADVVSRAVKLIGSLACEKHNEHIKSIGLDVFLEEETRLGCIRCLAADAELDRELLTQAGDKYEKLQARVKELEAEVAAARKLEDLYVEQQIALETRVKALEAQIANMRRVPTLTTAPPTRDFNIERETSGSLKQPSPYKSVPNVTTGGCGPPPPDWNGRILK